MNRKTLSIHIFFIALLFSVSTYAQNPEFIVEVSNDTVLDGNYIIVKYTLKNIEGDFNAPDFTDFDVIGGPMSSSMFSMVNGQSTSESSYQYYLKPKNMGENFIPPAIVENDNQNFETSTIKIFTIPNPDHIKTTPKLSDEKNNYFDFRINGDEQPKTSKSKDKKQNNIKIKKI